MSDDTGSGDLTDMSNLSEAEKRRLRRRQRILDNQGARLQRILTDDASNLQQEVGDNVTRRVSDDLSGTFDSVGTSYQNESVNQVGITGGDTSARNQTTSANVIPEPKAAAQNARKREKEPSITASLLEGLSGSGLLREQESSETVTAPPVKLGVQSDGTVILPKLSPVYGRVLLCLLAVFLSMCNAKRYLITFLSWEVAYYFISGLPPLPPANMLMVLAAVMGLREDHLYKVKKIIHVGNCIMIDLSLFLAFTMLPHVVKSVISV